ncbi:hypothetical protein NDU88_012478 [Pleurodeles waltl]|uniref:Uncharacterized protein n=1 Tax=Pleurodeles waltl TaxID=8319 RepID=A0AAV7R2X5_PLEWA|nr:hypothetical protein NDU88_012477 [Pleurodeles waltl]KAJ1146198.1 hypothetical protein NDU88_012478 [Pleurodeles waltl]
MSPEPPALCCLAPLGAGDAIYTGRRGEGRAGVIGLYPRAQTTYSKRASQVSRESRAARDKRKNGNPNPPNKDS